MSEELKEYKPLELDYNVESAVENLKTSYWSNDTEKYAKAFTEAEEIIINAICHHGYIVCKRPQGDIHDFIAKADEGTLFQLKKEIENALTKIIEREAYEEARREAMRLDDNEDTYKYRGYC